MLLDGCGVIFCDGIEGVDGLIIVFLEGVGGCGFIWVINCDGGGGGGGGFGILDKELLDLKGMFWGNLGWGVDGVIGGCVNLLLLNFLKLFFDLFEISILFDCFGLYFGFVCCCCGFWLNVWKFLLFNFCDESIWEFGIKILFGFWFLGINVKCELSECDMIFLFVFVFCLIFCVMCIFIFCLFVDIRIFDFSLLFGLERFFKCWGFDVWFGFCMDLCVCGWNDDGMFVVLLNLLDNLLEFCFWFLELNLYKLICMFLVGVGFENCWFIIWFVFFWGEVFELKLFLFDCWLELNWFIFDIWFWVKICLLGIWCDFCFVCEFYIIWLFVNLLFWREFFCLFLNDEIDFEDMIFFRFFKFELLFVKFMDGFFIELFNLNFCLKFLCVVNLRVVLFKLFMLFWFI